MSSVPAADSSVAERGPLRRPPAPSVSAAAITAAGAKRTVASVGLVAIVSAPALLGPGDTAVRLAGALVVAALALTLVALADGFATHAFVSAGELARALAGAGTVSAAAALLLAWRWPGVFSPLLVPALVCGIAFAGKMAARTTLIPAARAARPRTLVLTCPGGSALGEEARCRLESSIEVVARIALPAPATRLADAIAVRQPELVLIEAPVGDVDLELLSFCTKRGVRVLVLVRPPFWLATGKAIVRAGGLPWVSLAPFPLAGRHLRAKRLLDLTLVLLAAPFLVPVLAAIAAAVAVTSSGGVLYRQRRVGLGGRPFTLLKFRTMRVDAERETGPVLAEPADPRATPVGAFLRRLRLDELPQLWNVLRGEMSLVGPRPERPELASGYAHILAYDSRHLVRPGLTGLAQLVGGYSATAEDKLRCDLVYLSSRSLRLDLRLIAVTALAFLRGFPDG
jgi:lipopolysaccharide/colanic/teichoic acid biosynthesis glycosyltransferase